VLAGTDQVLPYPLWLVEPEPRNDCGSSSSSIGHDRPEAYLQLGHNVCDLVIC